MNESKALLEALQKEFIQEAQNAPKLFRDLSKVEQYIAESYKLRSLIELIQNADDADATNFGVHDIQDGIIVSNNGRPFSSSDVEALCRSGASNKYRGGSSIGYRGIGFKSVVNLAKTIFVLSGDYAFYFDKDITKKIVKTDSDVPLIRIPHILEDTKPIFKFVDSIKNKNSYSTFFIFMGLNERILKDELVNFDRNILLFLNNIRTVEIIFKEICRSISVERASSIEQNITKITEEGAQYQWEVIETKINRNDKIALKKSSDQIIPASFDESVIHSFMPTCEFTGAYFKINGDFSTDPSRKNIDMDEFSKSSFENITSLLADLIISIINMDIIKIGFFSIFAKVSDNENRRWKSLLYKALEEKMKNRTIKSSDAKQRPFLALRLRPDWINYEDYEGLCHINMANVPKTLVTLYPELIGFLNDLGIKYLTLKDVFEKINSAKFSVTGAAQVIVKIINQYRYDLTSQNIDLIRKLKIFPVQNNFLAANEITSLNQANNEFVQFIQNNCEQADIKNFFNKLNIKFDFIEKGVPQIDKNSNLQTPWNSTVNDEQIVSDGKKIENIEMMFKHLPNIKKWRSAETNVKEYLESLKGVLSVNDVSKTNMGYDLEVMLLNTRRIYVEVKSVTSFKEPISITNNEYSSAHNYGKAYYIAVVLNDEPIDIKFISDPINTLKLEKRIERWSWISESYVDKLTDVKHILQ